MTRTLTHPLSGTEVLLAAGRSQRPNAFGDAAAERCPFCRGHESDTPPAVAQRPREGAWEARVFPNLYPIVTPPDGEHLVIVETPEHNERPHHFSLDRIELMLDIYRQRFAVAVENGMAYALLFKNDGAAAGESIAHAHSQFIALREPPRSIAARVQSACAVCRDLDGGDLLIERNGDLVLLAPSASRLPFELMIAGEKNHDLASMFQSRSLAPLLHDALRVIARSWPHRGFNLIIDYAFAQKRHAAVSLIPRLTTIAGFELATNMLINVIEPARAAEHYRRALSNSA